VVSVSQCLEVLILAHMVHIASVRGEDIFGILQERVGQLDAGVEGVSPAVESALSSHPGNCTVSILISDR